MNEIEDWVSAQIDTCRPGANGAMDPMNRLANACLRLKGEGSGTLFGLQPPDGLTPNETLYRKGCDALATWFEHGDDAMSETLACFVRFHHLDVPIPDRFPPPAPPPEAEPATPQQVQAMATRVARLSPLWEATEWSALRETWDALLTNVEAQGGHVYGALVLGEPATVAALAQAQRDLGRDLPDDLVRAFLVAESLSFFFSFPPSISDQDGGYQDGLWRLADVPTLYDESRSWALDEADEEDRIWIEAIPFAGIDGAYLALWNGAVVFLEHEGDRLGGHGVTLAPNLRAFVEAWTQCGCPNAGKWWTLRAYTSADGQIDPETEGARTLRRVLGLEHP